MCTCPECGCCCDDGRECCPDCHSGNADHLGERGGCKRIDPRDIPAELRIGPVRGECKCFFCAYLCAAYELHTGCLYRNTFWDEPAGQASDVYPGEQDSGV